MKVLFIGKTGSGKTTICQYLHDEEIRYRKTQALEFFDYAIDTPGEYSENRMYYKAIIVTATDADVIAFVQSAEQEESIFPPGFATIFGKKIIGIVTKTDLYPENAGRAEELLKLSGVDDIYTFNLKDPSGIQPLEKELFKS